MAPDLALLRSLPARGLTLRELQGVRHAHFTTIGFQAAADFDIRLLTKMGKEGPASVLAMTNEAISFLQVHLQ